VIRWSRLEWVDDDELREHFDEHGQGVRARDVDHYLRSARETVQLGTRFTYRLGRKRRVGYYHPRTRRFTALTEDGDAIVTHFSCGENYVRRLPDSTYR
jgi:pyocin large subunit-like protein